MSRACWPQAYRGLLYVDEANLPTTIWSTCCWIVAAMGVNTVEREGISVSHPARFILVGTMNPEEGEPRPQLLDRFGLVVEISGIPDIGGRVAVIERRMAYDADPAAFAEQWHDEEQALAQRIVTARALPPAVQIAHSDMAVVAGLALELGVDGHRADPAILETARTHAAWSSRTSLTTEDIRLAAELALPHRMRRQPFTEIRLDEDRMNAILERVEGEEAQAAAAAAAEGLKKDPLTGESGRGRGAPGRDQPGCARHADRPARRRRPGRQRSGQRRHNRYVDCTLQTETV